MRKLLIVDDDVALSKAYERTAIALGFQVQVVNDSRIATETFLMFRPDLMVLDLMMPETDGIDVLNEVLLTGLPVRIIVTSGFGDDVLQLARDAAAFHASDRVSVLKKPIRHAELEQALTESSLC